MTVLATAGHVDHGKSTFVNFLTNQETDRLAEEKKRGLTINLGYTYFKNKNKTYSIVDVPGHSDFFKNTVSGFSNANVILFIIDSTQGWSKQSEQHFNTLVELGKENFIFVYTKIDLLESSAKYDDLEKKLDKLKELNYTVIEFDLKNSKRENIINKIVEFISKCEFRASIPSMWVDRSFIIDGIGRVITGTASSSFNTNKIYFSSDQEALEIKELQSINQSYEESLNSKRVAISLKKNNKNFPKRGNLLTNEKINFTNLLFVRFRNKIIDKNFHKGTRRLFVGTTSVLIKNIWNVDSASHTYGLIELSKKIPIVSNERFVIQNIENNKYIGGEFLFFINNTFLKKYIISNSRSNEKINSLYDLFTILEKRFVNSNHKTIKVGKWCIKEDILNNIEKDLNENYRKINKTGFIKYMHNKYFIDQEILNKLIKNFNNLTIVEDQITINLKNEEEDNKTLEDIKNKLGETLEVNKLTLNEYKKESIKSLFLSGKIYRISENIIISDFHFDILLKHINELPDEFTVSEFKNQTNLSRKYAIPMLELLDKKLVTSKINTSGDRKKLI
tara:strand:+ start:2417 stop:4102 length:1686 start_codon:yes stop_codon:yes gene_type:complete